MRLVRYLDASGEPVHGLLREGDAGDVVDRLEGDAFDPLTWSAGASAGDLGSLRLLAPVAPSKVVCVGRNFHSLLREQGRDVPEEPFCFLKASTAVVGPGHPIYHPTGCEDVAHEGELAVVVGRTCRQVDEEVALDHVLGYTLGNDITVRDWQLPSVQWWRAKSADSHCPLGPWVETELTNPDDVRVQTHVDGELRQDGTTADMVFSVPQLLAHLSAHMTLLPGDVVLTGTPAGIRPISPGDTVSVTAPGLGSLVNPVEPWPTRG